MRRWILTALLAAARLSAQGAPTSTANAAISGVVLDQATHKPLADYVVSTFVNATWVGDTLSTTSATKPVSSTTDATGRYRLDGLASGTYRISVRNAKTFGNSASKTIAVAGHDLDGINFEVVVDGQISGRVFDENGEPVPGAWVFVVSREYMLGQIQYFLKGASSFSNDKGEYRLTRIEAGHPYYLMAQMKPAKLAAHSETPLNPKLRRRVPMRTWYLNSPGSDGAAQIMLRPAEFREGVDIRMRKSPSYCVSGSMISAGGPAALNFSVEPRFPSSGASPGGGMFVGTADGKTGEDGAFRVCDLHPGTYRFVATDHVGSREQTVFGMADITVLDEDISGIRIAALPGVPFEVEAALNGPAPPEALQPKVSVALIPLLRAGAASSARVEIPGAFTIPNVMPDVYMARVFLNAPGLYVKDVTLNGISSRYEQIRVGGPGGALRVIIGQDGGKFAAQVNDKDGNPLGGLNVIVMPATIPSEAALASLVTTGETDQNGQFTSTTLAPGKYLVAAAEGRFDATPESIGRLWRSRNKFTELDLAPNGNAHIALTAVDLSN